MALTLAVNSVVQVRLNFRDVDQNRAFNILHYQVDSTGPGPEGLNMATVGSEVAQSLYEHFSAQWAGVCTDQVTFEGVTINNVFPLPRSAEYTYIPNDPQTGGIAGDILPLQDSVTLIKRTGFGDRRGIGRVFVVGVPESFQERGVITALAAGAYATLAARFALDVDGMAGGQPFSLTPVLFSEDLEVADRTREIIAVQLSDRIIKTQRRRRPGKGI